MKLIKMFTVKIKGERVFILSNEEIKKGDFVLAIDGYPHWLDFPQECTLIFSDNKTIGVSNCIRVKKSVFRKISATFRLPFKKSKAI